MKFLPVILGMVLSVLPVPGLRFGRFQKANQNT
jgi:hypothetical protein